jgi:DNA-binding transcriptional MocR family regulator
MRRPTASRDCAARSHTACDTLGSRVEPDDICITNGGQEALLLALRCVAQKGDVIAVESPTYHGLLG